MTRVTLAELKSASRDVSKRRSPPGTTTGFPTPMPTAASGVRRLHREGSTRATVVLNQAFDRSQHWGPNGPPQAKGWANSIRESFDTYVEMSGDDSRPVLGYTIDRNVQVGTHEVGVKIDVILLDDLGYVGRYLLWDIPVPSADEAALLAAPIVVALEEELGEGRVAGVEVWHLRTETPFYVSSDDALSRLGEAAAIVARYVE